MHIVCKQVSAVSDPKLWTCLSFSSMLDLYNIGIALQVFWDRESKNGLRANYVTRRGQAVTAIRFSNHKSKTPHTRSLPHIYRNTTTTPTLFSNRGSITKD